MDQTPILASNSSVAQSDRSASFSTVSYASVSHKTFVRQPPSQRSIPTYPTQDVSDRGFSPLAARGSRSAPTFDAPQEMSHSGRYETVAGQALPAF